MWDTCAEADAQRQRYWLYLCRCDTDTAQSLTPVPPSAPRRCTPATSQVQQKPLRDRTHSAVVDLDSVFKSARGGARTAGMTWRQQPATQAKAARARFLQTHKVAASARLIRAVHRSKKVALHYGRHRREREYAERQMRRSIERMNEWNRDGMSAWMQEHVVVYKRSVLYKGYKDKQDTNDYAIVQKLYKECKAHRSAIDQFCNVICEA